MNNLVKVLIGVGIAGAVATTTYIVTKKPKVVKKVMTTDPEGNTVETEVECEGKSILEKMQEAALKKAIKILAWVAQNQNKVEAIVTVISLAGAIFTVVNAVRDFLMSSKLNRSLDDILKHNSTFEKLWNAKCANDNLRYEEIMSTLSDILENLPKKVVKMKTA